jgi:PAS domain S-box-containing protein
MVNWQGRIGMVNSHAEKMFGYARTEIIGQPLEMLVPERLRGRHRERGESLLDALRSRFEDDDHQLNGLRKSGAEFPVEITLDSVESENGSMILATIVDMTDRQRKREESGYLTAILESSGDAIISKSLASIITSWNPAAEGIFGYSADEIIGRHISLLFPPDRLAEEDMIQRRIRNGEHCQFYETSRRHKSGREIVVALTISPIFGPDGKIVGSSKTVRDITGADLNRMDYVGLADFNVALETRLDEQIRERNRAWRNSRDLQVVVDKEGVYRFANDAWMTILGWRQDEVVGRSHLDFLHPDDHESSTDALARASVEALPIFENRFRHRDGGYRWISWVAAPEDGMIYANGRHITAEKEAAAKLAAIQDQLRQSQKMESLGQLTGGIAHDFNNLLGIIQLNLELIRERLGDDPEADEMAGMALGATERGTSLTHRLLAFARQQPLEPKIVNIETLLAGMISLLGRTLGANIEIRTIIPAGLWTTNVDPHQLENALLNLAINALHAMPDGGRLIIEASNKVFDEKYIELNADAVLGKYVMIAVTDTGAGMSAKILERVLEPFFTTKPVGKGTGLGLSMVHGFAKQSGGHLKIYSEVGYGTTVNLYLPRASIDAGEQIDVGPLEAVPSTGGELVLVVEDNSFLRGLTLRILRSLGYRAIDAEDGPTACEMLDCVDHVDLLLTDVVLPKGMNGPELAREARARKPGLKVLYMSGYPRDAVFRDGALDADTHLLSKPFPKAELAHMVRKVLDEGNGT